MDNEVKEELEKIEKKLIAVQESQWIIAMITVLLLGCILVVLAGMCTLI